MNNITSRYLGLSSFTIFVFTIMVGFNWYETGDITKQNVTTLVNLIGNIGLSGWLYSVGKKSNNVLISKGIELGVYSIFKISLLVGLLVYTLFILLQYVEIASISSDSYYSLIAMAAITTIIILRGVSKLLCSAESGKEVGVGEYYKTILLLIFPWIGVWFIHPRAKRLNIKGRVLI